MTVDDRRVRAVLLLANAAAHLRDKDVGADPADLLPKVTLTVHVAAGPQELDADGNPVPGIARVEGHGPVTQAWVRGVWGPNARFQVLPVFDPLDQAPVDAYEVPSRHRRAVRLLSPADCFPWGSSTSSSMQVDHTVPFDAGGHSAVGNYGPLTVQHHRIKTHGAWQVRQPFPGIFCWRDPHGGFYLVDHTGTRRVPAPAPRSVAVHVHHTPHVRLECDLAA